MNKTIILTALTVAISATSQAATLYNISSFNNDGTTSTNQWNAGITTITTAAGLTGTTDAQLLSLQTANPSAATATSGDRFRNSESHNATRETVTTDTTGYFQFGITDNGDLLNNMDLTSLTFQSVRATTSASVRGYSISVSVDGGAYSLLNASNVSNDRNDGLQSFDLSLTGAGFQGASSVDFRVASTGGGVEYTNFAINGDIVAVPEPSSAALLGLGGLALILRRRK